MGNGKMENKMVRESYTIKLELKKKEVYGIMELLKHFLQRINGKSMTKIKTKFNKLCLKKLKVLN